MIHTLSVVFAFESNRGQPYSPSAALRGRSV